MGPRTRYARNGDVSIAFQVLGDGPHELLFTTGLVSHVEHAWEEPGIARFLERLASFARLVLVDRRGTGLSDRVPADPSMDDEVGDLDAVLDAAGLRHPALFAYTSGGPLVAKYAVARPERVRALVLYACIARSVAAPGYEFTHDAREREQRFAQIVAHWGEGTMIEGAAPSRAADPALRAWFARMERLSASPGSLSASVRAMADVDVRDLLPRIAAPALVLHRTGDALIDVRHSRYLAEHIPAARLVELEGADSLFSAGDSDAIIDEVEEFLTGTRGARPSQRALRTVLFTDIVDGTARAATLGDRAWRDLLGAHDAAVRRQLARFGGEVVKTTGDGFLATFAGPPSEAVRCTVAALEAAGELGLDLRAGLHLGECELIGDDVGGMAVNIAARVSAAAGAGEVLVSSTVREASVGSALAFGERGEHDLKGVPGRWRLFAVADQG